MVKDNTSAKGFALPTVLITSVAMMIVLLAALTTVSSVSVSIRGQYYASLLRQASESGSLYARKCLQVTQNATWTSSLRPETDCNGQNPLTCTSQSTDPCSVLRVDGYRTRFEVSPPTSSSTNTDVSITAYLDLTRASNGQVYKTLTGSGRTDITQLRDPTIDRAVQRYWKVGNSGSARFDFGATGTSDPTVTPESNPSYREGLTVVNDIDGTFLFSSNGINVWNRNNTVMTGTLGANSSTSQGIIAFPIGGGNRYLIVANSAARTNSDQGGYGEFSTSIVDMSLNNGLGNIDASSKKTYSRATLNAGGTTPNQNSPTTPIFTNPNNGEKYTGEFMTAAPEAKGNGYWVVFGTPGRQYFYAILFDTDGQFVKVVRSNAPSGSSDSSRIPVCKEDGQFKIGIGIARFNTAYNKLAVASSTTNCQNASASTDSWPANYGPAANKNRGKIYVMNFDATTGLFSSAFPSSTSSEFAATTKCMSTTAANENLSYSIDFSPNEDYVYYTSLFATDLYRYRITGSDITAGSVSVPSTLQFLGHADNFVSGAPPSQPTTNYRGGQVRRAPNGKMYVANDYSSNISVVNTPDQAITEPSCTGRASNFSYNSVSLGGSGVTSGRGLPDYVTRYVPRIVQY